ncbi:MAG TPA: hypothetical protein VFS89_07180 [Nitrosospira sp.]|nr:hypothetical protein [Nitrosospira sp.]
MKQKYASTLTHVALALITGVIFGAAGVVQAQGDSDKSKAGQSSSSKASSASKQKGQDSTTSDGDSYVYGKDQASDYWRSQGYTGGHGSKSTGRATGMGSSSSQGSSTSGTASGSGGY